MCHVLIAVLGFVLLTPQVALGHGGRLDSSGGHHDRKNGTYHYHTEASSNKSSARVSARTSYRSVARSCPPTIADRDERITPTAGAGAPQPVPAVLGTASETEKAAHGKLELAKQLLDMKKTDAGTKWLQDLVQMYPDTKAAHEAQELLDALVPSIDQKSASPKPQTAKPVRKSTGDADVAE